LLLCAGVRLHANPLNLEVAISTTGTLSASAEQRIAQRHGA